MDALLNGINNDYKYGFTTDVESDTFAKGLDEKVVRAISKKKSEPEFMLNFRIKAYKKWLTMKERIQTIQFSLVKHWDSFQKSQL